jgi:hypothetical protein
MVGERWEATAHRIQRVAEDLGYLESRIKTRVIKVSEEIYHDVEQVLFGRKRLVHEYVCIKEIPSWYTDIVAEDGPE